MSPSIDMIDAVDTTPNPVCTPAEVKALQSRQIEVACAQACKAIAPTWPLDRAIAVNPHWSRVDKPLRRVAARMAVLGGMQVFPPRDGQKLAWTEGRISPLDLDLALARLPAAEQARLTAQACVQALNSAPPIATLPVLIDVLDNDPLRHTRLSWRQAVTHQVSQTCAAYFDEHQADWQPERSEGLYAFWRETLQHDHGISSLMGLPAMGRAVHVLPTTAQDAERWVMQRLGLAPSVWADYLEAVLLTVNGWASWCAYLGWQAGLEGKPDTHVRELLAIRLAWGALLLECKDAAAAEQAYSALQRTWAQAAHVLAQAEEALLVDEVWQLALELGYQRTLARQLLQNSPRRPTENTLNTRQQPAIEVQAAFCIDVRSEPLRRALEAASPALQTVGFAGFFGMPVAYTPLGTAARRPQLPGLLAPSMEVLDRVVSPFEAGTLNSDPGDDARLTAHAAQARTDRLGWSAQWGAASRWPGSAFSFVEAAGLGYVAKLGQWLIPDKKDRARDDLEGLPARYRPICRPQVVGLDLPAKVTLASGVLHAMELDHDLAPLVLLVGHGSQTTNNAHAAGLDCGACCGQTGEVNARSLALLLNEPAVRAGLQAKGITVPDTTWFVGALHNTTTDDIEGFDLDLAPEFARAHWARLQVVLAAACHQVRQERAPGLKLDPSAPPAELLKQLRRRANDGAQTRPEWGLAGNAAFIIAPRARSRGLALNGRSFLHDYDAANDADASVLTLLMTAPMLVTHWINWQYHASTCDPTRLGSGNKVLHNVVGGNIGVFEGNGGDLRIGLSRQSLNDGERWVHEPLRLTVVIDAPQQAIDGVMAQHEIIQHLLNNGWLHLWRLEDDQLHQYADGGWQPLQLTAG